MKDVSASPVTHDGSVRGIPDPASEPFLKPSATMTKRPEGDGIQTDCAAEARHPASTRCPDHRPAARSDLPEATRDFLPEGGSPGSSTQVSQEEVGS